MHRYRVSVTAQLTPMSAVAEARLRALTKAAVTVLSPDIVRIEITVQGRHSQCAVERAMAELERALGPSIRFARPPVWVARRVRPLGLGRRATGRWSIGGDDDGLSGVREPRRPLPSTGSAAAHADPDAA